MIGFKPHAIPEKTHPLVARVFDVMNKRRYTLEFVAKRSGVSESTIRSWRARNAPSLQNLEAVMNVLGLRLDVVSAHP